MSDEDDRSGGSWSGWVLAILAIYFGFPAVWVWPIWMVNGGRTPEWLLVPAWPVVWLMKQFPVYDQWVEWGGKVLGMS